jgi:hypothetical protein
MAPRAPFCCWDGFWRPFCDGSTEAWLNDDIDDAADAPFVARIDCGRAVETPAMGSDFGVGQGTALWAFFREAVAFQVPSSPVEVDPLLCTEVCDREPLAVELEEAEDIDDEELARWALFLGMNMRATSSLFMEFSPCPALAPHADLLIC